MKKVVNVLLILVVFLIYSSMRLSAQSPDRDVQNNISSEPVRIDSRLELFIDKYIIEDMKGDAKVLLHHPKPQEIAIVHDEKWEGSGSGYHSVFFDGEIYRMYYKAWQHEASSDLSNKHPLFCAYAESKDGLKWIKPNLRLFDFEGSKNNNIVFISGNYEGFNLNAGHPSVFKDENPDVSEDALYKAILISGKPKRGLVAFKSPDGINWSLMSNDPIITDGAFDSQNLAFWDPVNEEYRAYWRYFSQGDDENLYVGNRGIRTATSKDFITWDKWANVEYVDSPEEQLYTNQIKPYHRAPHIFIGFPARYIDRGWSESMRALPELAERERRSKISERYGTALTETLIMTSRDGKTFNRWNEAFIRPGIERKGTWTYGDAYAAWHIVETESTIPGAPNELSMYVTENYWKGKASELRRYTLRLDGFASINASMKGGEVITKPIIFKGSKLNINFSTSAAGEILVELIDKNGVPIPGFSMEDCPPIFGDSIEREVSWEGSGDLSHLADKIVQVRFILKDADLYSFQFK